MTVKLHVDFGTLVFSGKIHIVTAVAAVKLRTGTKTDRGTRIVTEIKRRRTRRGIRKIRKRRKKNQR